MPDFTTLRALVSDVQYLETVGHLVRAAKSAEKAGSVSFKVGERGATAIKDKTLPMLSDGDDVEVMGVPNPRSGWLEVVAVRNHTTGTEWSFRRFRARWP